MQLILTPNKAQYRPGETAIIQVEVNTERNVPHIDWVLTELDQELMTGAGELTQKIPGVWVGRILIPSQGNESGAYGLFVEARDESGPSLLSGETAFDVAAHWREAPRYGFLSDFAPDEPEEDQDVEFLNRHHLNLVQFYDWMYRHDQLLTDEEVFTDPLGRTISFPVVRRKIAALREKGIASMAYAAVYASLPDYAEAYPEQVLYQSDGKPYQLGTFFTIMDISPDSAWTAHIIEQFCSAIEWGFDGLQLDQYGFPKKAIRRRDDLAETVELKNLYPALMNRTREALPEAGLIFNDVATYPLHTTATAEQDVVYMEIWDPNCRLRHLQEWIHRARTLSGKQVVLAAYLPAFHPHQPAEAELAEAGAALVMATIFASGGYHISLGENAKVLTDPYFPNYGAVTERFRSRLTCYYDFIVMYRHLLFDMVLEDVSVAFTGGINNELVFRKDEVLFTPDEQPGAVWTTIKEKPGYLIAHLINLHGLDSDIWHAPHERPTRLTNIEAMLEVVEEIEGIYWATADGDTIRPQRLEFKKITRTDGVSGQFVRFTVPCLEIWTLLYVRVKQGKPALFFE